MFGILGEGEKVSQEDPHMLFKTKGGRLSTNVVKKSNSLEPLEKWRSRSLSVPAHWESKQSPPVERLDRISDSLNSAAAIVRDDRQDVPVEAFYRHILQLEDRLHTGAQEVAQLRLQNNTVHCEVAAAQGQIQLLTENLRNLEQAQANSVAVRSHDSRSLAVLQHTLQAQHNSVMAEMSARDSKAQTTEQESKQVQSSLNSLLQQLQNSVASGHISVEQVQSPTSWCLVRTSIPGVVISKCTGVCIIRLNTNAASGHSVSIADTNDASHRHATQYLKTVTRTYRCLQSCLLHSI